MFTLLCNRSLELFILQNWNSVPRKEQLPISPFPKPLETILLLILMILATLVISFKWSHSAFVFLWLDYFTDHNILKDHTCCCTGQDFLLFKGWVIFSLYIYFIHSSVNAHLDCFHFLTIVNNAAMNISMLIYLFGILLSIFCIYEVCPEKSRHY